MSTSKSSTTTKLDPAAHKRMIIEDGGGIDASFDENITEGRYTVKPIHKRNSNNKYTEKP